MFSRFLLLVSLVYFAYAASAPFITKCSPDDSKCIKQTAQAAIPIIVAGIPELGVEQLDPFHIKHLDASSLGLKLVLKDVSGSGLKDCVAKKVQRDIAKSTLYVKLQCTVDVVGKYDMKGHLLILPIEGNGDAHVVLRKMIIEVNANIGEKVGKDAVNHWTIKDYKHSYDLKEKSTIELENLFNGNEVLGRAARELIASSSNEVVKEVGPPIVKAIVNKIVKNIEHFFEHVPADELSL